MALLSGRSTKAVRGWRRPRGDNGTGGFIPIHLMNEIIQGAAKKGITLTPEQFVLPATEEQQEAS